MLKMELAEVVNPHFAVPVFGVVLCAVLVFAFGFKSSVQPPSFDFDEEKRLKRKKSKVNIEAITCLFRYMTVVKFCCVVVSNFSVVDVPHHDHSLLCRTGRRRRLWSLVLYGNSVSLSLSRFVLC